MDVRTGRVRRWWRAAAWGLVMLTLALGGIAQAAETTTYVLTDDQGTVLMLTDNHGNPVARFDHRPYGQQSGPVNAGPGYTGHVEDPDTGLVYMQQRYYDQEVGRFLSVDPLGGQPGDIWGVNRFAYAANSPISNYDPTGESCESNEESSSECPRIPTDSPVVVTATVARPITIELPKVRPIPRWLVAAPNPYLVTVLGLVFPGNMADCQEISCLPSIYRNNGLEPGYWPGDAGAKEWGKRHGVGAREGKGRFHGIKQKDKGKGRDKYGVNPETGDVVNPEGEVVGNLNDVKSK